MCCLVDLIWLKLFKSFLYIYIDLKSCYTNIPLHKEYRKYCCIGWMGKFYQFTRVPFGIKCAPACCQSLTSSLSGNSTMVYLDDFLILGNSMEDVVTAVNDQITTLESNGLPINAEKSVLQPTIEIDYRGYTLNFEEGTKGVYTQKNHLMTLSLHVKICLMKKEIGMLRWQKMLGLYNWCRAKKEDVIVHDKLVSLMNNRVGNKVKLDELGRDMLENMVSRCSLPFDY